MAVPHLVSGWGGEGRQDSLAGGRADGPGLSPPYLFGDVAILVNVVEVKGPLELLLDCSSQEDGEANHKVLGGREGEECQSDPRFYFQFAVGFH